MSVVLSIGRLSRRAGVYLAAIALAAAPLLMVAPAAQAAQKYDQNPSTTPGTVNCMSWQDRDAYPGACDDITPTLSCVFDNGDGSFSAALGFDNRSGYTLILPAGSYENAIYGNGKDASDVGQTSSFRPGVSTTEFVVDWTPSQGGDSPHWALGSDTTTLNFSSTSTPACSAHPVPIMGNAAMIGVAGGIAVLALLLWNRRSMRRKEWIRALGRA